jgi:hypothetical protein
MDANKLSDFIYYQARLCAQKHDVIGLKELLMRTNTVPLEKVNELITKIWQKEVGLTFPMLIFFLTYKVTKEEFEAVVSIFNSNPNPKQYIIIDNLLNKGYKHYQITRLYKLYDEKTDPNVIKILGQNHLLSFQIDLLSHYHTKFKFDEEEMTFLADKVNLQNTGFELEKLMKIITCLKSDAFSVYEKKKIIKWFNMCDPNDKNRLDDDGIKNIISKLPQTPYTDDIRKHLKSNITLKEIVYFEDMLLSPVPDFYKNHDPRQNNFYVSKLEKVNNLFNLITTYKMIKGKPANNVLLDYIAKFNPAKTPEPIELKPRTL